MNTQTMKPVNRLTHLLGVLLLALPLVITATPAEARYYNYTKLSDVLDANGLTTLKTALEAAELLQVLDQNRVTVFAPTNDVFDATAAALGCDSALDLALALLGIDVDGTDALTAILTYHAKLGKKSVTKLLLEKDVETINGNTVEAGVNENGFVLTGDGNSSPSKVTSDDIRGWKFHLYTIDQILLPFEVSGPVCSDD